MTPSQPQTTAAQRQQVPPGAAPTEKRPSRMAMVVLACLGLVVFAACFTHVWNFDIMWQLASGEWMLDHGRVLGHDPFSVEPMDKWVNVHWLFQVIITALHRVGAWWALSGLKAVLGTLAVLVPLWPLRRRLPAWALGLLGLLILATLAPRVRVRPEAFTLLWLGLSVVIVDSARRTGRTGRLWWMVPIMLVWVNMHGLFLLGLGVLWSGIIGNWLDGRLRAGAVDDTAQGTPGLAQRSALLAGLGATVACLITPWPLEVALHPLLLWTRISGGFYTYGVSEFAPTADRLDRFPFAVAMAAAAALVVLVRAKRVPLAHYIWLAAFGFLALRAVRNVGLAGPVFGFVAGVHLAPLLGALAQRWQRARRFSLPAAVAATVLLVTLAAGYATSYVHRLQGSAMQFGPGLQDGHYPLIAARFMDQLDAPGDMICDNFGDASTFIRHSWPKRLQYMDGRLEVHTLERFIDHRRINNLTQSAQLVDDVELAPEVRFFFVRFDSDSQLTALQQSRRFQLLHVEPVGATFARNDWPRSGQRLGPGNLAAWDRPLLAGGAVEGVEFRRRSWWAQNPVSLNLQMGVMLLALGEPTAGGEPDSQAATQRQRCSLLALRYLQAAYREGLTDPSLMSGWLAQSSQQQARHNGMSVDDQLPINPDVARALWLFEQIDMSELDSHALQWMAFQEVQTLLHSRQLDAASDAVDELLASLPVKQRVDPPLEYLKVQHHLRRQLKAFVPPASREPLERVAAMTAPSAGRTEQAIELLEALPSASPAQSLRLGDLLLNRGRVEEARQTYRRLELPPARQWELKMRLALCDWAQDRPFEALAGLEPLPNLPAPSYYRAALLRQMGRYEDAMKVLRQVEWSSDQAGLLAGRMRSQIGEMAPEAL